VTLKIDVMALGKHVYTQRRNGLHIEYICTYITTLILRHISMEIVYKLRR